jgi:hypothetical protein
MERHGDEVHVETDEARGASTPNIVRWILLVSLFAAIALLSIIWITGAATQSEDEGTVSHEVRDRSDEEATDSIVGEDAGELDAVEIGDEAAQPTVENEASDEPSAGEEQGAQAVPGPEVTQ